MKTRAFLFVPLLSLAATVAVVAQDKPAEPAGGPSVDRALIATSVENREPVGEAVTFPAEAGRLYCYTTMKGASGDTFIYHVWKHGAEEVAKVKLDVKGASWRTWSSKQFPASWTGDWTVEIQDADGKALKSVAFTVGAK